MHEAVVKMQQNEARQGGPSIFVQAATFLCRSEFLCKAGNQKFFEKLVAKELANTFINRNRKSLSSSPTYKSDLYPAW